jgi:hypothetical protein
MRRLLLVLMVFGLAALATAPSALATFHLTRVTEVLTSSSASTAQQFVELQDPAEPFPAASGPYWLVVYSATGMELGAQQLANAALAADAAQGPILISTAAYDAAGGTSGDFALTVSLPTAAGQACFAHEAGKAPVHCMTWGTIQNQIANPLAPPSGGPAPGDGLSLQKQCDGTAAVGAPTPAAANAQLTAPCVGKPPVTGPSPGAGGGSEEHGGGANGSPGSFAGVVVRGLSARASGSGAVKFSVACPARTSGGCAGKMTLRDGRKTVASASFSVAAGKSRPVRLRLHGAELDKLRQAGRLKLRLVIAAHDGTGASPAAKVVKVTVREP